MSANKKIDNVLWNSGKVKSGKSSNVKYKGKQLSANSAYFWKVCTWDKNNNPSAWSGLQRINTGDFNVGRSWPVESKWIQAEMEDRGKIWTFENRHPISYHDVAAVKKVFPVFYQRRCIKSRNVLRS